MARAAPIPPNPPPDPGQTDLLATPDAGFGQSADPNITKGPDAGTSEVSALPQLPIKIATYRIDREIARGGMGVVLSASDPDLGRDVAIKVLLEEHAGRAIYHRWFVDEARITARLQHPGIVPVFEMGQLKDNRPFFVMQYVPGQTLEALLATRSNPLDELSRFVAIFEQVCQTVAYAHSQNVIHCDLKPLNVMVAPFGAVKVMDWGLAVNLHPPRGREVAAPASPSRPLVKPPATGPSDSGLGQGVGTPAYLAPEQALQNPRVLDFRTDVFGLGGLLCTILTGEPPYPGKRTKKVYQRAAKGDVAETFTRLDASPAARELITLAKACLAPKPDDRPRSAGEVMDTLSAYLQSDMRRAERDLMRFFELTPDLFCIAGFDGYFRRVNQNFSRVLGYSPEQLVSRPFIEFVHPHDRDDTAAEAEKLTRGLLVVHFRNRYRDVHGNYRWFEWAAKSIREEGTIFAVARDITDWVGLEDQLRREPN